MIMALIALGLNMIFGLLHIINMAHGALYMLGAVVAWYLIEVTGSFWIALVVAPLCVGGRRPHGKGFTQDDRR
jgi:branched-chain amino acid transport system permease protein